MRKQHKMYSVRTKMKWDFFISYASEDKESFVEELAKGLKSEGYKVWYDDFSLKAGDSIRRSIDKGIAYSKYGLVILSDSFFKKEWPQKELDALISIEASNKCKVIPVWLEIGIEDIRKATPLLVDKYAIKVTRHDKAKVISEVVKLLPLCKKFTSDANIDRVIRKITSANQFEQPYLTTCCLSRLNQIVSYHNERLTAYDFDVEDDESKVDLKVIAKLRTKYEILEDIHISEDFTKIKSCELNELAILIKKWVKGLLKPVESYELYFLLDEYYDFDYLYILFGIPNYIVSSNQHKHLQEAVLKTGCRQTGKGFTTENKYIGCVYDKYSRRVDIRNFSRYLAVKRLEIRLNGKNI